MTLRVLDSSLCLSRVCAVLEANAKVYGRGKISHPRPTQTPEPIWMAIQTYHYVRTRSGCAKFGGNRFGRYESAHA